MKTIWKFPLNLVPEQEIELPRGAEILCVQNQRDDIYIWALVDPDKPVDSVKIIIEPTGHKFDASELGYVGTVQTDRGRYVWHVFGRRQS